MLRGYILYIYTHKDCHCLALISEAYLSTKSHWVSPVLGLNNKNRMVSIALFSIEAPFFVPSNTFDPWGVSFSLKKKTQMSNEFRLDDLGHRSAVQRTKTWLMFSNSDPAVNIQTTLCKHWSLEGSFFNAKRSACQSGKDLCPAIVSLKVPI